MADSEASEGTQTTTPESPDPASPMGNPLNALTLLASAGLTMSLVLEFVHYRTHAAPAADSFCAVGQAFDCTVVAASPASIFFGIPWALWGTLGYVAILSAALLRSKWLLPLAGVAALTSIGLFVVSLLSVGSLCYLCEAVHVISLVLLFVAWKKRSTLGGSYTDLAQASSIFATPLGGIVALALFLPPYWGSFSYKSDPPFATGVTDEGHPWIGSETPDFVFEEFIDYNCPHCKAASARNLRRLMKHDGWRLIRRQQPRMRCPVGSDYACQQVRLVYCANQQGKFWQADRWLFAHQNPRKNPEITRMIQDLQLNDTQFKACYSSKEAFDWAQAQFKDAQAQKIVEVPGYSIDGKRFRAHEFEEHLGSLSH